jgi:hypothetical protein
MATTRGRTTSEQSRLRYGSNSNPITQPTDLAKIKPILFLSHAKKIVYRERLK